MKSVEEQLKNLILTKFKSIRDFAITVDMPYSTIDSIFKRGVGNASITNVNKICKALNISADTLADGEIQSVRKIDNTVKSEFSKTDEEIIKKFMQLTERNKIKIEGKIDDYLQEQQHQDVKSVQSQNDVEIASGLMELAEEDARELIKNNRKNLPI